MDTDKTRIIHALGLQSRMTELNRSKVSTYTRPSYQGSPEEERDEVHRMSEIMLLHNATGIRVGCLVEEDYYGEKVEYVVMSNFHIITRDGRRLNLVDVDVDQNEVITASGRIPFSEISREPE